MRSYFEYNEIEIETDKCVYALEKLYDDDNVRVIIVTKWSGGGDARFYRKSSLPYLD